MSGNRERAAYHEAGHCAAAIAFGIPIIAVTIEADAGHLYRGHYLGCEGILSKRLGSLYKSGRSPHWLKVKNPKAPALTREAEEDWGRSRDPRR